MRVAGVAVDVRALVLTVLHLLSRRALAEHLAKVPIELPEGLARGRHRSPTAALSHSLSSPTTLRRGSLLSGCCAEGLLFPGDRTAPKRDPPSLMPDRDSTSEGIVDVFTRVSMSRAMRSGVGGVARQGRDANFRGRTMTGERPVSRSTTNCNPTTEMRAIRG